MSTKDVRIGVYKYQNINIQVSTRKGKLKYVDISPNKMFIEIRKIGKNKKYYLIHSYREGEKVKRIAQYLGSNLNNQEIAEAEIKTKKEILAKIHKIQPETFLQMNNGDPWMLGEDIPDCDPYFATMWTKCFVSHFKKHTGKAYNKIMIVHKGMNLSFYFGEKNSNEVGENILQKFLTNPEFIKEVNKKIENGAKKLRHFGENIPIDKLHKQSNQQLWDIYKKHHEIHQEYYTWGWIPVAVDMFHGNLTNKLMTYLEEIGAGEKCSKYFSILTQPTRPSPIQIQEHELLLITQKIQKNAKQRKLFKDLFIRFEEEIVSKQKLAPHTPEYEEALRQKIIKIEEEIDKELMENIHNYYRKYFYVKFLFIGKEGTYSFRYFLKKVVKLIGREANLDQQIKEIKKRQEESKKKITEIKKLLRIKGKWEKIFDGFGEFMITKVYRRYAQIYTLYKMHLVLEEIAKRMKVKKELTQFMLPEEVMEGLLFQRIDKKEIKKRTNFCVYYAEENKHKMYIGKQAQRMAKQVERKKIKGITELKGHTGCLGTGKGKVKIIIRPSDMMKMNKGDILVSIATDPDIVPAMKKAAAIVTEQGGVTSHAAIVARELNIPCVIGTKIATQVLEDGDLVEVDATNGTVRVLEKGKKQEKEERNQKIEKEKPIKKRKKEKRKRKMTKTQSREEHILWFNDINKEDTPSVGGKGSSLGEMHSVMAVPNGFCITTAAYKKVLKEHHDEFLKLLENNDVENQEQLTSVANIIKSKVLNVTIPTEMEASIKSAYKELGGKVAVRSSATSEDLDDASFAGQQDTFLNINGEENVLAAVKKCWASLFNARAIYYREKNNYPHDQAFLSVVIQKMVDAEKAGVLFTMNPINKSYDEMIIEACFGLGEKLVSGEITPDTFIMNIDGSIKENYLNFETRTLSDEQLKELTEIGKKIAKHYGKPMDIEWAIENNKIHILQARPITTK